jgi:hypothetical protein
VREPSSERLAKRDPWRPVATDQRLPKAIGPDSVSVRRTVAFLARPHDGRYGQEGRR